MTKEHERLAATKTGKSDWLRWGPYLSERQWGTVREDYSSTGTPWEYFTHDHARSRAYRWGEDGIAGWSDSKQLICFSVAMWNGVDPIIKERLFGLTGPEGNHGEDVKEIYYYLDSSPTHSYAKMLYKYPQCMFPYQRLVDENKRHGKSEPEFELLDTGIFGENRYFDIFIEFTKATVEDTLVRITVHNRGPESAELHLLPHICFRNIWTWDPSRVKPRLSKERAGMIELEHEELGKRWLYCDGSPKLLFCENGTNLPKIFGEPDSGGYYKDGINEYVVKGNESAINPQNVGTKAAANYVLKLEANTSRKISLRLSDSVLAKPFEDFEQIFADRIADTDEFYAALQRGCKSDDERLVQRQAFAGMLWSKQFYNYDVRQWLDGDPCLPAPPAGRKQKRNADWRHLNNGEIISMPDKWEYPWYAAWDLAFHTVPLALLDPEFAKSQLVLLTREWYMHPNGQFPAYEWNFSNVNPPVHAWATWRIYKMDREQNGGAGDHAFLERVFQKLLLNFTWWVNKKDSEGNNIFGGGFLGLDNIGVFDRSATLPTGGNLEQSDATSWMAMYCLNMLHISIELALTNNVYEDLATKFFEHFLYIAGAMANIHGDEINLWDEEDQFFYDVLLTPESRVIPLKVRSIVGLIPLFAVETIEPDMLESLPVFKERLEWFLTNRPDLAGLISRWKEPGAAERRMLSLLRGHRMKRILARMLDETEFLSDYGIRGLSRVHKENPYVFNVNGVNFSVAYQPAESDSPLFGGNSNWRGPIWFPINYLIIESLHRFHHYYGDDFKIECPTGSGKFCTIKEVAEELTSRLAKIFLRNDSGNRPVFGDNKTLQNDPQFKDYIPFYEYFHGDTGRGVGASHQTGWTGLIAKLIDMSNGAQNSKPKSNNVKGKPK